MHTQFGTYGRAASLQNAAAIAAMFGATHVRQGELYLPAPAHEIAAQDIDSSGTEDIYAVRLMPLTDDAGKVMAAGATATITFEPLKWVQILNFVINPTLAADLVITNFYIGQDPQFPAKGVVPADVFATDATDKMIDVPWCGPGVPLEINLKNVHASASRTFYGAARVRTLIGNKAPTS